MSKYIFIFLIIYLLFSGNELVVINCETEKENDSISVNHSFKFYENNCTYFDDRNNFSPLEYSLPEKEGMKNKILLKLVKKLERSPSVFSFIIIRNNKLIIERYFNKSNRGHSSNIHSLPDRKM